MLSHYTNRPVVVTGCASGIGAAVARILSDAKAWVVGVDRKPADLALHQFISVDLGDLRSIESAISSFPRQVWAVFNCAGLSGGAADPLTVVRVNFLGLRELVEAIDSRIPSGGAIVSAASAAGRAYWQNSKDVLSLVRTEGFTDGEKWIHEHASYIEKRGGYRVSKEAIVLYTMARCWSLGKRGVRINAVAPGVTDTPMLDDSARALGSDLPQSPEPLGRRATADEQAKILIFLNSGWASYVNGQTIWSDGGAISATVIKDLAAADA